MNRRVFLASAGRGVVGVVALSTAALSAARLLRAQGGAAPANGQGAEQPPSGASNADMSGEEYKPVRRPPKPGAKPQMTAKEIEDFERQLACPCPCTLDIYVCRTTMFSCSLSPAVHADVQVLVDGGYSAEEIMTAMTDTYGDFILMTPRKQGFNLLAWFAPFAALGVGAVAIGGLLRGWRRNARKATDARAAAVAAQPVSVSAEGTDATPEELARLDAALRGDR